MHTIKFNQYLVYVVIVKKGILTGLERLSNTLLLMLDIDNNKGFSGASVCSFDINGEKAIICGVVSGYSSL